VVEAKRRLAIAQQYRELAMTKAEHSGPAGRNAAVGNAVLAAIAASDAICCLRLGLKSSSSNHSDSVTLLKQIDISTARDLSTLIGDKPAAHYGASFMGAASLKACLRAMNRLVKAAEVMMPG